MASHPAKFAAVQRGMPYGGTGPVVAERPGAASKGYLPVRFGVVKLYGKARLSGLYILSASRRR
ncbi:hypothetical protein CBM2633_A30058 [Cupriavidus taiwanensis]|uniref:Uncharacterized protein n=1 Tax=Cupriavidus taiwanensis TaxID=164546 RepID=A0A375E476_9BURK|nr:hypothetical protein CBM2615_A50084 [Cupriavidus taiwanensis]SOZ59990.1 hypothetical protein CBM2614_A50083 [Cupriavidus taiwanensis]SOZ63056.1 hypothetical protein CBM2613_A40083 [Cupriavidus taiwanensis]SPA06461.1 hypothetical protein CBM2625_A40082 [Cupriavidus taiwanensis]SPA13178.1 hypothetical protein CBM2633_A30058 [Cupriavidus taiwanensis]